MLEVPHAIRQLVKDHHVVVLCVGSNYGDDAAGPMLHKLVNRRLNNIKIFLGGTAPESSLSQIAAYKPDTVIMFNAVDRQLSPGDVVIEDLRKHHDNFPLLHKFPLSLLAQIIALDLGESVQLKLVGIQAKKVYGRISKQVAETVANLASVLVDCDKLAR
jgi:hydrogenase maturation protease